MAANVIRPDAVPVVLLSYPVGEFTDHPLEGAVQDSLCPGTNA